MSSATYDAYVRAAAAWSALLADAEHLRFMEQHYRSIMDMVVVLAHSKTENAFDWAAVRETFKTEADEQLLLTLVFAVQDLVEVVIREQLTFLIDEHRASVSSTEQSASQREVAEQQEALVHKLPEPFRLAFLQTLRENWVRLTQAAAGKGVALTKLQHLSWRVVRPFVLMRIVTSDSKRRIIKVPIKQFHELRYSTAKVLQEMNEIEAHPIMRLTNMEKAKNNSVIHIPDESSDVVRTIAP